MDSNVEVTDWLPIEYKRHIVTFQCFHWFGIHCCFVSPIDGQRRRDDRDACAREQAYFFVIDRLTTMHYVGLF